MQGLVDVGRMGCSSLATHSANIHQSKDTLCHSEPLATAFHPGYQSSNEHFHYNMVSKVAHGTERVNRIKDFKVLLASKGLKLITSC
jgi:hypothetical protein